MSFRWAAVTAIIASALLGCSAAPSVAPSVAQSVAPSLAPSPSNRAPTAAPPSASVLPGPTTSPSGPATPTARFDQALVRGLLTPTIATLVATPTGFLLAGDEPDGPSFLATGSADGRTWTARASDDFTPAFTDVAVGPGGWVASQRLSNAFRGAVWTSSDGEIWRQVPPQPTLADAIDGRVVAGSNGFVMLGQTEVAGTSLPAIFSSPDGSRWSAPAVPGFSIDGVVAVSSGYLAHG